MLKCPNWLFLFALFSVTVCQEELDQALDEIYRGNTSDAVERLPSLIHKYPESPTVMFMQGLLERNVERSIEIYKSIYNFHPGSPYADEAVMKIGEYYYTLGLYTQSSEWLKKMHIHYDRWRALQLG